MPVIKKKFNLSDHILKVCVVMRGRPRAGGGRYLQRRATSWEPLTMFPILFCSLIFLYQHLRECPEHIRDSVTTLFIEQVII